MCHACTCHVVCVALQLCCNVGQNLRAVTQHWGHMLSHLFRRLIRQQISKGPSRVHVSMEIAGNVITILTMNAAGQCTQTWQTVQTDMTLSSSLAMSDAAMCADAALLD